ncbi:MAG: DUF4339 domain-containing protein, partial [Thermoguttaceae bacterium]
MADQWYYSRQGQQCGPVTPEQLKQLAATGQLQSTDLVWKQGMAGWVAASEIKGLLLETTAHQTIPAPPPPPVSQEAPSMPHLAVPPKSFLERAKGAAANVAANAKAAAQIAGKQAEHGKITQMTLPSAYWALGKDIHGDGRFRDEFGELFTKLDGLLSKIQSLKQAHPASDQPQKFTDRAKAAAGHAVDLTKAKAVEMEVNGVLHELGKRAYEQHGENAGAENMVQPVAQAIARLETLDREIAALTGGRVKATWARIAIAAVAVLIVLWIVTWLAPILAIGGGIAVVYYWKRLAKLARWASISGIVLLLVIWAALGENADVTMVKTGHLSALPIV